MSPRLRLMASTDLTGVLALEQKLFPEDAWSPEMFAHEFAETQSSRDDLGSRYYLVAEEGNVMVGYSGMLFPGGEQADVLTLAVDPGHWGRGIGSALLSGLLDEALRRSCAEVFLEVRKDNPRARNLYRRNDFTEVGIRRGYYQPSGVDAVVMRKLLWRGQTSRQADSAGPTQTSGSTETSGPAKPAETA
jgi:[ribosomal protein S18]-alanine N-acetyltransferase